MSVRHKMQLKQHTTAAKCAEHQEAGQLVPGWSQAEEQGSSIFCVSTAV